MIGISKFVSKEKGTYVNQTWALDVKQRYMSSDRFGYFMKILHDFGLNWSIELLYQFQRADDQTRVLELK